MENWQIAHIKSNLPRLIKNTRLTIIFLSCLESKDILTDDEMDLINAHSVNHKKVRQLYSILQEIPGSYACLLEALNETNQNVVLNTLLSSIPNIFFENLAVVIGSTKVLLGNKLDNKQMQNFISLAPIDVDCYNTLVCSNDPISLVTATIPESDPSYIRRHISRRLVLDSNVFKEDGNDIFVFKNISRLDLRKFIEKNPIESSNEQVFKITCRFILLDAASHWDELRKSAAAPIHLVTFMENGKLFVLKGTSGGSEFIQKFLQYGTNQVRIEETDLIRKDWTENKKGFCICDSPGMGKTMLLAYLARYAQTTFPDRIVSFVSLAPFAQLLHEKYSMIQNNQIDYKTCRNFLTEWLSTTPFTKCLLDFMIEANLVQVELFFDGLDEVQTAHMDGITQFLILILENMPNCRLYATSRTHLRTDLERVTRFVAYDIEPFDEKNQTEYLVSFWLQSNPDIEQTTLSDFAHRSLEIFRNNIKDREGKFLGIPLQCRIYAEIYSYTAKIFGILTAEKKLRDSDIVNNVWKMYKLYMEQQIPQSECSLQCMLTTAEKNTTSRNCKVKCFHTRAALNTIFPKFLAQVSEQMTDFPDPNMSDILNPGVLIAVSGKTEIKFLHRSFAEYLCAEFFSSQFRISMDQKEGNKNFANLAVKFFIANLVQENSKPNFSRERYNRLGSIYEVDVQFWHPLTVYFFENFATYFPLANTMPSIKLHNHTQTDMDDLFSTTCAALKSDYVNLLQVFLNQWLHSERLPTKNVPIRFPFNTEHKINLLNTATRYTSATTIKFLIDLFSKLDNTDLLKACKSIKNTEWSPLDIAVKSADYEKVSFFSDKVIPEDRGLVYTLMANTYGENKGILDKRKDICNFLLDEHPKLLTERYQDDWVEFDGPVVAPQIDSELVLYLIGKGADVQACMTKRKEDGFNIISSAASYMNATDFHKLTEFLVQDRKAFHLFRSTGKWHSPLPTVMQSVKDLNLETVHLIFEEAHANVNDTNEYGCNLLQCAIAGQKSVYIIRFLRVKGVDPAHRTIDQRTSLHIALEHDNNEAALYVTSLNCIDVEERDNKGQTPILVAAKRNNFNMIDHLLSFGASLFDMDNEKNSIFISCIKFLNDENRTHEFVIYLQEKCMSICPLEQVSNGLRKPITNCVAELFGRPNKNAVTPVLTAFSHSSGLLPNTLEILLAYGKSRRGKLLKYPFDINAADNNGKTTLHACVVSGRPVSVVKMLVENGLDWRVKHDGSCNITHLCVRYNRRELLEYFVGLGCDVNELDNNGNTALQCLLTHKEKTSIKEKTLIALSNSGINKDNVNYEGKTAHMMLKESDFFYHDFFNLSEFEAYVKTSL